MYTNNYGKKAIRETDQGQQEGSKKGVTREQECDRINEGRGMGRGRGNGLEKSYCTYTLQSP